MTRYLLLETFYTCFQTKASAILKYLRIIKFEKGFTLCRVSNLKLNRTIAPVFYSQSLQF